MTVEHPFAQFIRIIGKGPNLSRPLDEEEMFEAATMLLKGDIDNLQLGAFLCILRMRTEVPAEGAGFVRAVRDTLKVPANAPKVDVDWASYSGKKRQLPWYLLASFLLAHNDITICMQGTEGHTGDRLFTIETLRRLGVPISTSLADAADRIKACNFAYIPLENLVPKLQEIIELKWILGVRTPINTFARMINPFDADHEMQTVFHPNYVDVHRDTAALLGQKKMVVFKGEGGEAERRPHKPIVGHMLVGGQKSEVHWPALLEEHTYEKDEVLDTDRLAKIWSGAETNDYAENAIIGTAAIVLQMMGRALTPEDAVAQARAMWDGRPKDRMVPGA